MPEIYQLFETQLVTDSNNQAYGSDFATFEDGRSVVVWDNYGQIFMQMYDQFGEKSGDQILVAKANSESPDVTILPDGTIAVAYTYTSGDLTVSNAWSHISIKDYDFDGNLLNQNSNVGDLDGNLVAEPVIEANQSGGIDAVFHVLNKFTGRLEAHVISLERNASGDWTGESQKIDDQFAFDLANDVVTLSGGEIAVGRSHVNLAGNFDAMLTFHNDQGTLPETEYQLSLLISFNQYEPAVALGEDDMIFAAWTFQLTSTNSSICVRFIAPYTGETEIDVPISTGSSAFVLHPDTHMLADGNFLVTWSAIDDGVIHARKVTPNGELLGSLMEVTSASGSDVQRNSKLESYQDNGVVMSWETESEDELRGDLSIGWFDYLPDLEFLSDANDTAEGTNSADLIDLGAGKDHYMAEAGYDIVKGGNGADYIHGGNGWDRLFGESGTDELQGGRGNDELNGGGKSDYLNGGQGNDRLYGNQGDDELWGKNGKDFLFGGTGNDLLYGNSGNDEMGGGSGNDTLNGGHGQDQMFGHSGNDILSASNGADLLDGGANDDILTGGSGKDTFKFGLGNDQITDFDAETDKLLLDSNLLGGSTDVQSFVNRASIAGDDIVFDFGSENTLTLLDFTDMTSLADRIEIF